MIRIAPALPMPDHSGLAPIIGSALAMFGMLVLVLTSAVQLMG